ncbi:MAG: amino acid ABC transporter permease [Candidatus Eisenbacteria bacterium]|nr:amino acid ABC transporter permease [Candidatus Eisenbacteria bacterium]
MTEAWQAIVDQARLLGRILVYLLPAVPATLQITLAAFAIALVLGVAIGILRTGSHRPLRAAATVYVDALRGIPLLVQIFFLYFGLGRILSLDRFPAGVLAIGIGYSAYIGETIRAGIQAVPAGQWEAARSLGLTTPQCLRHVVLPQAMRIVIPPVLNDFVACLKDSSLVSILGLRELTRAGREYYSATFSDFQTWTIVALLYLAMTLVLSRLSALLERRLHAGEA